MKITFKTRSWFEEVIRTVQIKIRKDGCLTIPSQRALLAALKETKGIEVEDA